jgi:hypothetical protein
MDAVFSPKAADDATIDPRYLADLSHFMADCIGEAIRIDAIEAATRQGVPAAVRALGLRLDGSAAPLLRSLSLQSAYGPKEPRFTTYTATFQETIDYIFCGAVVPASASTQAHPELQVVSTQPIPTEESIKAAGDVGVPSMEHPSDHFPLLASVRVPWM